MRRTSRARFSLNAWLFGIGVPLVALFGIFSLLPYESIMARWPLGIDEGEKTFFQRWFDQRPVEGATPVKCEVFELSPMGANTDALDRIGEGVSSTFRFVTEGAEDTVNVSAKEGEYTLVFPEARPFRAQHALHLLPATVATLARKYAEVIAAELQVPAPSVSFVRVNASGKDLGLFAVQEVLDGHFLRNHQMSERALGTQRLNTPELEAVLPEIQGDASTHAAARERMELTLSETHVDRLAEVMDVNAFAAEVLLLRATGTEHVLASGLPITYDPADGRFRPLFDPLRSELGGAVGAIARAGTGALLAQPAFRERVNALAQRTRNDSDRVMQHLVAVDRAWVSILANGMPVGMAQAQADGIKADILKRLWHPEVEGTFASIMPVPTKNEAGTDADATLDPWLDPFREQGDTIRFRRGKYTIDHDLILPRGFSLVLEKGTRFFIAAHRNIVVHGALIMRGTDLNPVFIRPLEEGANYGTIAVQGNGHTASHLRGLRMSGGEGAWMNGVRYEAMLSFHQGSVTMDNCDIEGGGISVEYGEGALRDSRFTDLRSTAFSVAFSSARAERCTFTGTGSDSARAEEGFAAVQARASKLLVRNCQLANIAGTALHATRAAQVLALNSIFERCAVAVTSEDLSVMDVDACTFTGDRLVFRARRTDPLLGGAYLTLYSNVLELNGQDREVDAFSTLATKDRLDPKVLTSFAADTPARASTAVAPTRRGRRGGSR